MRTFITSIILLVAFGCGNEQKTNQSDPPDLGMHKVLIKEIIQTKNYTYIRGIENKEELWIAFPKLIEIKEGELCYYTKSGEMKNFKSKELDRVFESILFVEEIYTSESLANKDINTNIKVEIPEGGISIEELLENKDKYEGESVIISGIVTKYNEDIMNKNWLHLKENDSERDITITTDDVTSTGEIIIVEGKVSLNKDLGAGYFYDILIEDAVITKQKINL